MKHEYTGELYDSYSELRQIKKRAYENAPAYPLAPGEKYKTMDTRKFYIKAILGTYWMETEEVRTVNLADIQGQEPNGYHATCTMTHEISDEQWNELIKAIKRTRRSKRSVERENKKKRYKKWNCNGPKTQNLR